MLSRYSLAVAVALVSTGRVVLAEEDAACRRGGCDSEDVGMVQLRSQGLPDRGDAGAEGGPLFPGRPHPPARFCRQIDYAFPGQAMGEGWVKWLTKLSDSTNPLNVFNETDEKACQRGWDGGPVLYIGGRTSTGAATRTCRVPRRVRWIVTPILNFWTYLCQDGGSVASRLNNTHDMVELGQEIAALFAKFASYNLTVDSDCELNRVAEGEPGEAQAGEQQQAAAPAGTGGAGAASGHWPRPPWKRQPKKLPSALFLVTPRGEFDLFKAGPPDYNDPVVAVPTFEQQYACVGSPKPERKILGVTTGLYVAIRTNQAVLPHCPRPRRLAYTARNNGFALDIKYHFTYDDDGRFPTEGELDEADAESMAEGSEQ